MTARRELHSYRLQTCTFTFSEGVSISRNAKGKAIAAVEFDDPHLTVRIASGRLDLHERHPWEAWKDSLRGGLRSFLAYDMSRAEPLAYRNGGVPQIVAGTWNGEGTASALSAYQITATGAPAGFTMSAGDHIGLVQGGRYWVGTVEETVTRGASTIVVPINPAIPLNMFGTGAAVVFRRPKAEFILVSDTWSNPVDTGFAPISFEGVQKL